MDGVLQYLDDTLIYAKDEEELLELLEKLFTQFERFNLKMYPGKFVMYVNDLTWGGKTVDGSGVRPSDKRQAAIQEMPEPTTLVEMM